MLSVSLGTSVGWQVLTDTKHVVACQVLPPMGTVSGWDCYHMLFSIQIIHRRLKTQKLLWNYQFFPPKLNFWQGGRGVPESVLQLWRWPVGGTGAWLLMDPGHTKEKKMLTVAPVLAFGWNSVSWEIWTKILALAFFQVKFSSRFI